MKVALYYIAGAVMLALLAWVMPHWSLQLLIGWSALSMLVVSTAYWLNTASIFRKRQNGTIPFYIRWLFIPFLTGTHIYNVLARRFDKVPALQHITDGLYLGCRLTSADVPELKNQKIEAVLDVTAEFDALDWSLLGWDIDYLNIPVLDHACPTQPQLSQAVNWLAQKMAKKQKVVVHCALGRGRSVLVLAAYLLTRHNEHSAEQAVELIKAVRHTARLNSSQLHTLRQFAANYSHAPQPSMWLVVNPVAGAGKWQQNEEEIMALLSPFFSLTVKMTSESVSGTEFAQQALSAEVDIVVACGGDGTVTEVASVLCGTQTPLGIIPLGTTNALSQALWGFSATLLPVRTACVNLIEGHFETIDTARCNGNLMLLLAGIGFEQQMIEAADRETKNALGQLAYLSGLWQAVNDNQTQQLLVSFDEEPEQYLPTSSLVVANAAPLTSLLAQGDGSPDIKDGQLDVTWLEPVEGTAGQLVNLAELALASLTQSSPDLHSHHRRVSKMKIRAPGKLKYVIDGELFSTQELKITIEPASLKVFLPWRENSGQNEKAASDADAA